jgi:histidine triad (HIT) family protein
MGQACIFCQIASGKEPAHIVYRDSRYIAFLDKYPRTRGHLQLAPIAHYRWIYDLPDMGDIFSVTQRIIRVIIPVLGADHVTIGTFGHEIAHAHIWVVPQYGAEISHSEEDYVTSSPQEQDRTAQLLEQALLKEVS